MSLQTDIEAIVGSVSDITSATESFCREGNRYINKIIARNPAHAERLMQSDNVTNSDGMGLNAVVDLIAVTREDSNTGGNVRVCNRISYANSLNAVDSGSIYFATLNDPKYFIENNTLKILPVPTAQQAGKVKHVSPDVSFNLNATSIANLPSEFFIGVVLYAALQVLQKRMNEIDKPTGATNLTNIDASGDVNTESDRININKWFNIASDYIVDEDVELATTYLNKISTYLQTYQTELTGDTSQYGWYESQYFKTSSRLMEFLRMYSNVPMQPTGVPNEAAAND